MPSRKTNRRPRPRAAEDVGAEVRSSRLRLFGVAVICAYVALVPLVFDHSADFPFTVPKALLTHVLAYLLCGVIAGLVLRFGWRVIPWSWLHVPVLAFLGVNALASIVAADPFLALYGTHARMLGLGTIAAWTVLYFGVVVLIRTRADLVALAVSGLVSAALMLAYEGVQLLRLDPFTWSIDVATRPISTNGQPTTLASYLTVLALAALAVGVTAGGTSRRIRALLLLSTVALLAGAAATATRSVLLGIAAGGAVLVAIAWLRSTSRRARAVSAVAAAAAAVAIVALVTLTPIGARVFESAPVGGGGDEASLARLDLASLDVRAVLYGVALDAVRERPILGYGPDNFVVAMTRHRPEVGPDEARLAYATSAHGWIGQTAVGSGLLGLGAFLAIVAAAAALTLRSRFSAVTCAGTVALAAYLGAGVTTVSDIGSDWVFWVAAGLIASSTTASTVAAGDAQAAEAVRGRRPSPRRAAGSLPALAVLPVVAALALALTAASAMQASRSARAAQDARLLARVGPAVQAGLDATSADPGRAEYWHQLGFAYIGAQRWRDAAFALEHAVQLAPWDSRNISDLIQTQLILARDGDAAARRRALELADAVVRADPNYPAAQFSRAVVMQFTGNDAEALRAIERAMILQPGSRNEQWYVMATQLYVAAGRPADGVDVARRALTIVGPTVSLRIELARALVATGQLQDALTQVDAILATEPANATAQELRAQIQLAMAK